jgi:hypothetical protein
VPTREAAGSRAAVGDVVVTLPGLVLRAEALTADAVVRCTGDGPRPATDGAIGRLTLNGVKLASGDSSLSLPLGLVAVHVNHVQQTATSIRRRALWIQTPLGDVVVAEASAGTFGAPCSVAVPR